MTAVSQPTQTTLTADDEKRVAYINERIPGWSGHLQYVLFKEVLLTRDVSDLLMLGVYAGRDIAYILDIAGRYCSNRQFRLMGVDKFNAEPCADWPEEKRGKTWQEAVACEAPSREKAHDNLAPFVALARNVVVVLVAMDDAKFLSSTAAKFDFAYLDTAHDYDTVFRQCAQVPHVCRDGAVIGGDDYSDKGTWGVCRAVKESFTQHEVIGGWLWIAEAKDRRP